jgi:hypothetical protein
VAGLADEPTFAGELLGVRTWRVEEHPSGGEVLTALAVGTTWARGPEPIRAMCWGEPSRPSHVVPVADCSCGIYALYPNLPDAYDCAQACLAHPEEGTIAGVIEAWGKVEAHSSGFRAEWARPSILFATRSTLGRAKRLAAAYGARAQLVPSRSALRSELASLTPLSRETVSELLEIKRALLLTPARGDRWSCGFDLAEAGWTDELPRRGGPALFGVPFKVAPSGDALQALQSNRFNLAASIHLEVRATPGGGRIGIWDQMGELQIGELAVEEAPELADALAVGRVRRALIIWQWRDHETDERIAIRILASPIPNISIAAGPKCPPFMLAPDERLF